MHWHLWSTSNSKPRARRLSSVVQPPQPRLHEHEHEHEHECEPLGWAGLDWTGLDWAGSCRSDSSRASVGHGLSVCLSVCSCALASALVLVRVLQGLGLFVRSFVCSFVCSFSSFVRLFVYLLTCLFLSVSCKSRSTCREGWLALLSLSLSFGPLHLVCGATCMHVHSRGHFLLLLLLSLLPFCFL